MNKLKNSQYQQCQLFEICNCKTAVCRVLLPDESCYYYRYFKKLIENNSKAGENK